jgi:hypothetical protein
MVLLSMFPCLKSIRGDLSVGFWVDLQARETLTAWALTPIEGNATSEKSSSRSDFMTNLQSDQFPQFIASIFTKMGISEPWAETNLLADRRYVGRKFRAGGIQIVWWIEKNLIEVFDQDGKSLEIIDLAHKLGIAA